MDAGNPGSWRFDAPNGEFPVTYLASTRPSAFAEVYGDQRSIPPSELDRRLSRARFRRPLQLIGFDDGAVLKAFGLDLNINAAVAYRQTQQWSLALHEWYDEADGILYVGRHATTKLNRCLFLDRCADALEFEEIGRLRDLRSVVLAAADAYSLAPRLFDRDDRGGWP